MVFWFPNVILPFSTSLKPPLTWEEIVNVTEQIAIDVCTETIVTSATFEICGEIMNLDIVTANLIEHCVDTIQVLKFSFLKCGSTLL